MAAKLKLGEEYAILSLLTWHYTDTGIVAFKPLVSLAYCGLMMLALNFFGAVLFQNFTPK